jgi:hypothetical protein
MAVAWQFVTYLRDGNKHFYGCAIQHRQIQIGAPCKATGLPIDCLCLFLFYYGQIFISQYLFSSVRFCRKLLLLFPGGVV